VFPRDSSVRPERVKRVEKHVWWLFLYSEILNNAMIVKD
jgi:hypothetical protein